MPAEPGISRRLLLEWGVALALQAHLAGEAAADEGLTCFVNQSAMPRDGVVAVGVVVCADVDRHAAGLAAIRAARGHRRRLSGHSNDRYGAAFCLSCVDYLLAQPDMRFMCALVDVTRWPDEALERDQIVIGYHRRVLDGLRIGSGNTRRIVIVNRESLRTEELARAVGGYTRPADAIAREPARSSDLLQLAGYLAACLRSAQGKVRIETREALATRLGAPLDEASLRANRKFQMVRLVI